MTTSLYAALCALVYILLTINVVMGRRRYRVAIGDAGNDDCRRRIRVHGNFAEYAPLFLIMLALAEHQRLSLYLVHALGILFLVGRVSHAYGLLVAEPMAAQPPGNLLPRSLGMVITFLTLLALAVILLCQYFGYNDSLFGIG